MPQSKYLLTLLDEVDSTNNYAMAKITEGLAQHGQAWFANLQTAGKGQRGKNWQSDAGKNVIMSICIKPKGIFMHKPYFLSALVATCVSEVLQTLLPNQVQIKWPNDIFIDDRKAGGILIENQYRGKEWAWAVVGIGLNINQTKFGEFIKATSLTNLTGKECNVLQIAEQILQKIIVNIEEEKNCLKQLNSILFKKEEQVKLKKGNATFETTIKQVNEFGELVTQDVMERNFKVGEVEWLL
jgi:BirA family transcriptional regulator, biotin operon repressor / biotin---[acetyl-CoA-carboxylase] ligase